VIDLPEFSPLDAKKIVEIARVPVDTTNLFSLKLSSIESRLLAQPWIRAVTISKHFPQTVSISVSFRKPVAIYQMKSGTLLYIDKEGSAFAPMNLKADPNLPIIIGFYRERIPAALQFIQDWSKQNLDPTYQLSSIEDHPERGIRVMVTYPMKQSIGRTVVELGKGFGQDPEALLGRLREVMTYLSQNNIRARQVFADLGKKIVVRIARSS